MLASINRHNGAGNVGTAPAAEVQDRSGDVVRSAEPTQRYAFNEARTPLSVPGGKRHHSALEWARRQGVDRDVLSG